MITAQNLTKTFGNTTVVDNISFELKAGQTLALIGTSGSGKTTTLKMLNRLIEPTSGSIYLNGQAIQQQAIAEMRRQMGYVIQQVGLFPHYTIAENIATVPQLLDWPADRIAAQAKKLLTRLGLPPEEYLHRYPAELSGGQQQRVGIARALAADPPLILMDEPFSALDPITRSELRHDFLQLEDLRSKTVVFVTHDVEEAFELADLICLLDGGQLQQLGTPQELLFQPANDFVKRFLAPSRLRLAYEVLQVKDLIQLNDGSIPTGHKALSLADNLSLQQAQQQLLQPTQVPLLGQLASGQWFRPAQLTATAFHYLQAR
ncbi:MAG: ABC transporter ATP-binding protein [Bacteroidota bacterium]